MARPNIGQVATMGFLNLKAWRSAGGRVRAERTSGLVQVPPTRYYYDQLPTFQAMVDSFGEVKGHRPPSLDVLFLWVLESEGAHDDDVRAADLADWMSYFEVESNSLLAIVNLDADRLPISRRLLTARSGMPVSGAHR
jgi:hypothetical protein